MSVVAIGGIVYIIRYFIGYIQERDGSQEKALSKLEDAIEDNVKAVRNNAEAICDSKEVMQETYRYLKNRNGHLEEILLEVADRREGLKDKICDEDSKYSK